MAIKQDSDPQTATSGKVKQVYFPVESEENGYHLLSILTSSGLMYQLKQRINEMRFSEATKQAREDRKSGEYNSDGLREIYGLTGIGYGGTKPQNISALNNQNGGVAYLLGSMPPELESRPIRLPKNDFFNEVLWSKAFDWAFQELDYLLNKDWHKTFEIRNQRDAVFEAAIYQTQDLIDQVRESFAGWSDSDTYENLPDWQKYWLDQKYENQRDESDEYLDLAMFGFTRWFLKAFEAYLKANKTRFDDVDLRHFIGLGDGFNPEAEQQFKEAFR
jgi:CRISPR-associated protein Csy1